MSCRRFGLSLLTGVLLLGAAPPLQADDPQNAKVDEVRALIAKAGDAAKHDADAVVALDETDVLVRPSGIGTARTHLVTKILREPAIRSVVLTTLRSDNPVLEVCTR